MNNDGNKVIKAVPITVVVIILVAYFFGWEIGAYFNKDSTAYSMAELTAMVNQQIDEGQTSGVFYIKDIDDSEIENINDYVCSLNGVVDKYSILDNSREGKRIMLEYDISDNYYVYEKYVNRQDIPSDRPLAVKLYQQVCSILDAIITEDMSDYEKELAIHDYIVKNCEYGFVDYSKDYAFTSYGALVQNMAVCNGYAEAMALLLSCVGIENEIMTGVADGELHAWNRVLIDGEWYQVDATWDDPMPDRGAFAGHMFFNVTDDVMDDTHNWETEYAPCDATEYNYFVQNDLICDYDEFQYAVKHAAANNISATIEIACENYSEDVYNMDFIFDIGGVEFYQYSNEPYGDYELVTIYLNQRD